MNDSLIERFTIEGDTLYFGRSNERHGYNLGQLTDRSFNALDILNQQADEIERLSDNLDGAETALDAQRAISKRLTAQLKQANAVISRTYDLVKLGRYQAADNELRATLETDTLNDRGSNQYVNSVEKEDD